MWTQTVYITNCSPALARALDCPGTRMGAEYMIRANIVILSRQEPKEGT